MTPVIQLLALRLMSRGNHSSALYDAAAAAAALVALFPQGRWGASAQGRGVWRIQSLTRGQ